MKDAKVMIFENKPKIPQIKLPWEGFHLTVDSLKPS